MATGSKTTRNTRMKIIRRYQGGANYGAIGRALRVSPNTVRVVLEEYMGIIPRLVKPYRCDGCRKRTGLVPHKTTLQPCQVCRAYGGKL